jgi:hypothetical protein
VVKKELRVRGALLRLRGFFFSPSKASDYSSIHRS